ncbi:MAG: MBL fold metallo-hydrolase [Deltaproteobacteria bacterium]|nr:MBL fold metallo-hydrolase [Deltaproteobacteria bacterium]
MRIKCWGSRGSIPVCGAEYLKYGGDTTCMEIQTESGATIIVDAGTGIRRLGNHLMKENILKYHFIFTHAHWDHLMGFPFFKPLYAKDAALHMHRCPFQKTFVETMLSKVMTPPNFPIRYADVRAKIEYEQACPTRFDIGSVTVIPIPISHPNSGSGYKFIENGKQFVFLTDNELGYVHSDGLPFEAYRDFCEGADLLIHDAEYTPEEYRTTIEWGHSVYTDVLKLAVQAGVKQLGLFHLNQERTDPQMDVLVADCNQGLREQGSSVNCFAVAKDMVFEI